MCSTYHTECVCIDCSFDKINLVTESSIVRILFSGTIRIRFLIFESAVSLQVFPELLNSGKGLKKEKDIQSEPDTKQTHLPVNSHAKH